MDYIVGAGLVFGLGFLLALLTEVSVRSTLIWFMVVSSFVVEARLLPLWVFVVLLLINVMNAGLEYSKLHIGGRTAYEFLALSGLISLSVMTLLFGGSWLGFSIEGDLGESVFIDESVSITGSFWGAVSLILYVASLSILFGIGGFLSDSSVKTLTLTFGYVLLWGLFTQMSIDLILQIPIFGTIIYTILTIVYALGLITKFQAGE
ncbi:MAG: hypothetical protein GF317_11510 [Candidatus Lokiarchaeota archaeon]|nr:hypothetical protein [Candidatus Lokiarchaeota archaeon]MBD3200278.1 hypothetical protein [Candidatus Lokiarchaeota archaeon]